jgi:excinuclease ABC subunit A
MKLLQALKRLRDLKNTVIVVEHDEETMKNSDFLIDLGPGAGKHGGELIVCGPPEKIKNCKNSLTIDYLYGKKEIAVPKQRLDFKAAKKIEIKGCKEHNLKKCISLYSAGAFYVCHRCIRLR